MLGLANPRSSLLRNPWVSPAVSASWIRVRPRARRIWRIRAPRAAAGSLVSAESLTVIASLKLYSVDVARDTTETTGA
ncbi:hypothetical protein GCM10022223_14300 [Kineosporia mesophila]|uniref:Uncharacterized protein n=1 Tax=Kineosporia mesophila TaxID=566012 RepID=A0ABP6Z6G4_9ACTN